MDIADIYAVAETFTLKSLTTANVLACVCVPKPKEHNAKIQKIWWHTNTLTLCLALLTLVWCCIVSFCKHFITCHDETCVMDSNSLKHLAMRSCYSQHISSVLVTLVQSLLCYIMKTYKIELHSTHHTVIYPTTNSNVFRTSLNNPVIWCFRCLCHNHQMVFSFVHWCQRFSFKHN